jgi:Dyp-type peroxidase family
MEPQPGALIDRTKAPSSTPIREAPAPDPIHGIVADPSHPPVPDEPMLDVDNVQGNILGGFNKDHQMFLFYQIHKASEFREWLREFVPFVSTSAEVIAFNRLFKSIRTRHGEPQDRPQTVKATWRNIAFTYPGLEKLRDNGIPGLLKTDFRDKSFKLGLAAQAPKLGDPVGSGNEGDPAKWVVGGPSNPVHVMIHVASDDPDDLEKELQWIRDHIKGTSMVMEQRGKNLPHDVPGRGDLAGHEHFGFLDGVSQPGLRGRISTDPHDVLTPRQNPNNRGQGKPGQDLLWPGEFVFGYPGQKVDAATIAEPGPLSDAGPEWAANGSFLVFRRLKQDVFAFHNFLKTKAPGLGLSAQLLGAKLVGRWPSGAPVLRTPDAHDNPQLGSTDCANNNFEFQDSTLPIPAEGVKNPFDCSDHLFTRSEGDKTGLLCPFAGHIRKAYPRDDVARSGDVCADEPKSGDPSDNQPSRPAPNEVDTQTHRLLRRGIPFGEASNSTFQNPVSDDPENGRGLLFLAYQTSIERQFEFVTQNWVNNPNFKDEASGHDFIIGQNPRSGENRKRRMKIKVGQGAADCKDLETTDEWVIPTGGGYFFAPSIEALRDILAAPK